MLYVTDERAIPVHSQPAPGAERVGELAAGTAVEIQRIQGDYALITTAEGLRGWVANRLLTSRRTAAAELEDREATARALRQAVADKRRQLAARREAATAAPVPPAAPPPARPRLPLWLAVSAVLATLGFIAGWRWHRRRVRRRLGGTLGR